MSETLEDLSSTAATVQQSSASARSDESLYKDTPGAAGATSRPAPAQPRSAVSPLRTGQSAFTEVEGDPVIKLPKVSGSESSGGHEEVGVDSAESSQEYVEATEAQMASAAAESGEETALSDLRGMEGYLEPKATGENVQIRDASESGEELFPLLAALVPTLVSTAGPLIARAVAGKLSSRAKTVVQQIAKWAGPTLTAAGVPPKVATGVGSLLPMIAKLLESALAKEGGESADSEGTVNEEFVTETAAAMEVIIGLDQRIPITNTTDVPWRRICALRIEFPSGATYRGTGFFIGPRAIATAGHCVFMKSQGGWARKVEVIPGCNGSKRPFGQVQSTAFRSVGGWVNNGLPEYDYGCIFVPPGSFNSFNLGSFGVAAFDAATLVAQPAVLAGYPGDKPFAELWGMAEVIKAVSEKTLVYQIDSVGGQSGAPVYIKRAGVRYVVGIHNYGAVTGNSATRVTRQVYDRLVAWKNM